MKTRYWIPLLLIVVIALSACAPAAEKSQAPIQAYSSNSGTAGESTESYDTGVANQAGSVVTAADSNRVVIKNAQMEVIADDPAVVLHYIKQITEDYKGFITDSNLYKVTTEQGLKVPGADIAIRVPAEKLEDTIMKIEALLKDPEKDITYENITGEDVTAEYTDLTSRLHNLESARDQYQKIMDATTKTEDVLAVYNQLISVNEQIEVLRGQIKYYDEASRLSSLKVHIVARESVEEITIGGWEPVGVARDAIQTLIDTLQVIVNIIIWFVLYVLPTLIAIALPIALFVWIIRALIRSRKHKRITKISKPEDPQPPQSMNN